MNRTALISLLSSFSRKEIKEFEKFLDSPYFNNNKSAVSLFAHIKSYHPEYHSELLTKQNIYSKVFPNEPYNDVKFRKLISDLNKLAEKFVAVERLCSDENHIYNAYMNYKKERNFFGNSDSALRNWNIQLEKLSTEKDDQYYFFRYCFNSLNSYFDSFKPGPNVLLNSIELISLVNYFSLKRMQLHCIAEINKVVFGGTADPTLLNELLILESTGYFADEPLIRIYCNIARLFERNVDESGELLEFIHKEITEFENKISRQERIFLYWVVSQYFVIVSKKYVKPEYGKLKWHYLRKQVELQIEEEEKFSWPVYLSIVNNGLAQNEIEWTGKFINECSHLINFEYKDVLVSWAKARLLYAQGKFKESLKELLIINYPLGDMKYNIDALTVMNYYELGLYNEISYCLQSFKKYLKKLSLARDKDVHKATGLGFIKAVNLLVKLQYSAKAEEKVEVINRIKSITETRILNRSWVVEKLENFITSGN